MRQFSLIHKLFWLLKKKNREWNRRQRELSPVRHMKSCSLPRPLTHRKPRLNATGGEVRYIPIPRSQAKFHYFWGRSRSKDSHLWGKSRKPSQSQDRAPMQRRGHCWVKHRQLCPTQDLHRYKAELVCHRSGGGTRMLRRPYPQPSAEETLPKIGAGLGKPRSSLLPYELNTE